MPLDVQFSRVWQLIHNGGFLTYNHHDSNGMPTAVTVVDGAKFWVFCRRKELSQARNHEEYKHAMVNVGANSAEFDHNLERFVVILRPGEIL